MNPHRRAFAFRNWPFKETYLDVELVQLGTVGSIDHSCVFLKRSL